MAKCNQLTLLPFKGVNMPPKCDETVLSKLAAKILDRLRRRFSNARKYSA